MSREFTPAFKKQALRIVEELNGDISSAADNLNIPSRLLTCWVRRKTLEQVSINDNLTTGAGDNGRKQKRNNNTRWPSGAQAPPPMARTWQNGYRKKNGLMRRPYEPENFQMMSSEDARMALKFLTRIQNMTTDMLKLTQSQISTVYPVEVEMCLPVAVHTYCHFDLLKSEDVPPPELIHFTVLLSANASGFKMKPVMIVEGIPDQLTRANPPADVEIVVMKSTAFDENIFTIWKQNVWLPFNNDKLGLIIVHMSGNGTTLTPVYENIGYLHENTMVAIMPKNLTHLVHPAIVFWIEPFAEMLRVRLAEWLKDSEGAFVQFRKKRIVNYELFAFWVDEAWKELESKLIVESFEACGLTHFTPTDLHAELKRLLSYNKSSQSSKKQIPVIDLESEDSNSQPKVVSEQNIHSDACN